MSAQLIYVLNIVILHGKEAYGMTRKCKKCGEVYDVGILKYIKSLWRGKMIFRCETCEELVNWKRDEDINQINENSFSFNKCNVKCYDNRLYDWIYKKIIDQNEYCELRLRGNIIYHCFPADLKEDYLVCRKDEYDPNIKYGTHRIGDIEKRIPLNYIVGIEIIDVYKDYFEPDVKEPVFGFKGIEVVDGILKAKDYIYELGIPYEEPQRIRPHTDYQDVYSHFCIRIEDVLNHRDFITSLIAFSEGKGRSNQRLFEVKAEGHCFENTTNGWVSNKLTVIREVTKEEIIEYFNQSQKLKLIVEKFLESRNSKYEEIWSKYAKADIRPYRQFLSDNEIDEMIVKICAFNKSDVCIQDYSKLKFEICEQCSYYKHAMEYKKKRHCYLTIRNTIRKGAFNKENKNYEYLLEHNFRSELEAVNRLLEYT